jgi:hypothetical protein
VIRLIGPALLLYLFTTAYLDRREVLGRRGRIQLVRRLAEMAAGVAGLLVFGKLVDQGAIRAGSGWVRFLLLTPAVYGVATSATGLLHVVHLLFGDPKTPYRIGWLLFWLATATLAVIAIIGVLFPYGLPD